MNKKRLGPVISILALWAVVPLAHASDAETDGSGAAAPSAEQGTGSLQEVIVTATKRNEDIQSVGVSITALTAPVLEAKGVEQFFDYGTSIPNLSFGVGAADGSLAARGVYLRGIEGANTTGFYIDDTPVLETLDPHIVDVARIEVLRGPQGTLYGAESMGGTVRIITAQPDASSLSGQIHSSLSDTDHGSWNRLIEGDINIPLVSQVLSFRASGFYQFDSGWFDKWIGPLAEQYPDGLGNEPTTIVHDVGSLTYWGGQLALRFEPIEGLSFTPRIMYQETDADGDPYATYDPNNLVQREVYNFQEGGSDRWWLGSFTANYATPFGSFVSSTAVFDRRTFELEDDSDDLSYSLGLPYTTPGSTNGLPNTVPGPITRSIGLHRFAQ